MQLPKKITPDRIKDSIIEIKYSSALPLQVLVGFIFKSLDDSYSYSNQPIQSQKVSSPMTLGLPSELTFNLGNHNIFYTDSVKIELRPNSFVFNCLNEYIGWELYFQEITKAMGQISSIPEITSFNRVGVRYISEYPDFSIKEITNYEFTFGIKSVTSDAFAFRTEFMWEELKVILNIQNNAPTIKTMNNKAEISKISTIDIDIIADKLDIKNTNDLFDVIQKSHQKEKEVFFHLLKGTFIETLNPTY